MGWWDRSYSGSGRWGIAVGMVEVSGVVWCWVGGGGMGGQRCSVGE